MDAKEDPGELGYVQDQLRLQSSALDAAANAIVITDIYGDIIWVNPAFVKMTGYSVDEALGENPRLLKSGKHSDDFYTELWKTILDGEVWLGEITNKRKDGSLYIEEQTITPVRNERGVITHFIGIKQDITARKRAEQEVQRRVTELGVLHNLANAGSEETTEDALIERATHIIRSNLYPDKFGILLLDMENEVLKLHPSAIKTGYLSGKTTFRLGESIIGKVAADGHMRRINDIHTNAEYTSWDPAMHSALCVPLKVGDHVLGVIDVESANPDTFTPNKEQLLATIAGQLATAIERVRLFEEVQQLANTDPLTGIYNRRYFFKMAKLELERVRRYQLQLSTIMFDIDHFKSVNDTFGHAVGDRALILVAGMVKENLREVDLFGRYGGEEFVILLPETDLAQAQVVAERLRQVIAQKQLETEQGPLEIKISLGVCEFWQDCPSLEALLDRADQALYTAKNEGRDQVVIWAP